jgi:hypothetical protein
VRAKTAGAGAQWIQGDLVRMTPDTVLIRDPAGADTARLAASGLTRLEVSRGRRSGAGKGARLGFGVGAGAGLVLGVAAAAENCSGFCPEAGPGEILIAAAILGGVGAGIGALIGSASHGERWQRVTPGRPELKLRSGREGVRIGVALRM